jgi:DNA-binding GntR family transcriptional regulator
MRPNPIRRQAGLSSVESAWESTLTSDPKRPKSVQPFNGEPSPLDGMKVDKRSMLPAYAQMANILRACISRGDYAPGEQLPSESAIAKANGVSAMTARQAVSVLEKEGLVHRIQGRGTFVRRIGIAASSFELDPLADVFADKENLTVRIIDAAIKKSPGRERIVLGLAPDEPVVLVKRIIFHRKVPYTIHESYTRFDPKSPTVESMLDTVVLTELIFQDGYASFKQGVLRLLPARLNEEEAGWLKLETGMSVFKLEHLFYDFDNSPAAFGWFVVSPDKMPLISKIGIWDE